MCHSVILQQLYTTVHAINAANVLAGCSPNSKEEDDILIKNYMRFRQFHLIESMT